jgi:hypothetical protein
MGRPDVYITFGHNPVVSSSTYIAQTQAHLLAIGPHLVWLCSLCTITTQLTSQSLCLLIIVFQYEQCLSIVSAIYSI